MLSVLTDQSIVSADGRIDIRPGISKVHGSLLEEYLIVGSDVSVKTLPMLDVQSSDVTASHGARIERIDDKKLFYMMSKGISKSDASRLMIQ
jgi:Fe-S cluster assembly scaffold protein SufB